MVRITIEASSGAARFSASVQGESIERALEIVERQNPGKDCKVRFPIDAEAFFCEVDSVAKQHSQGDEERIKGQCSQDSRRLLT